MKIYFIVTFLSLTGISLHAQNSWVRKTDFGGVKRNDAVGVATSSKGYIGTGGNLYTYYTDFWEYNPLTGNWSKKADFPGNPRKSAVGFSVGDRVYIGTGIGEGLYEFFNDFWEYNPSSNTWSSIPSLPDTARWGAFSFSIGNKGYVGTGLYSDYGQGHVFNSFWEYNTDTYIWTKKADFAGGPTYDAVGFAIGNKGYVYSPNGTLWQYDPNSNVWLQKANMDASDRLDAVSFTIGNIGFVCTGFYSGQYFTDVNKYDPNTDTWTNDSQENFGGGTRDGAVGFAIGDYGYIGTGYTNGTPYYFKDFWRYNGSQPSLVVSPQNQNVSSFTGSTSFAVTANNTWAATSDASWCTVTPSGSNNGTIVANYSANTSTSIRTANIQVKFPGFSQPIQNVTVTQEKINNSIENTVMDNFQIYPNPTTGSFKIVFELFNKLFNKKPIELTVHDFNGQAIFKKQLTGEKEYEIDLSNAPQGCYAIILRFDSEVLVRKVLIVH